jgi:hypothetical protein
MSIRTVLANLTAGNQPVSLIDQLLQDVWDGATMSCTASGTNVITLTPRANVNAPTAYRPNQRFSFDAAATSTGSVTLLVGSLATLKLFQPGGAQAGAGNIVSGNYYEVAYDPTLDGGAGGFIMLNSTLPSVAQPVQGEFKNLVITNTTSATAASHVLVTADQVLLWNASNGAINLQTISLDINANASGANGLDTGSFTANTWYYVWVIYNGVTATTAGLLSASATAPTMPSGFTYKARFGAIRAGAGPAFLNMMQKGRRAQYLVGTFGGNALAALPNIANGTAGTDSQTAPTYASVSISNFAPTTASEIMITATNAWNNTTQARVHLAPNNNYGGGGSVNPPPLTISIATSPFSQTVSMELESTNIFWSSSQVGGGISAFGWSDNI